MKSRLLFIAGLFVLTIALFKIALSNSAPSKYIPIACLIVGVMLAVAAVIKSMQERRVREAAPKNNAEIQNNIFNEMRSGTSGVKIAMLWLLTVGLVGLTPHLLFTALLGAAVGGGNESEAIFTCVIFVGIPWGIVALLWRCVRL